MRTLAVGAALAALLLGSVGGCEGQQDGPTKAAETFARAARVGDMKALMTILEYNAVAQLEAAAERASDQVGGRRTIEAHEMLQVVDVDPRFELAQTEEIDNDGSIAHVRLIGTENEQHTITLVLEDGAWHVRIPTPPITAEPASSAP